MNKLKLSFIACLMLSLTAYADLSPVKVPKEAPPEGKAPQGKVETNATFHFYATTYSPDVPTGTYSMKGTFDPATHTLSLKGVSWIKRPKNFEMVSLEGRINEARTSFTGNIDFEGCKEFILKRTLVKSTSPLAGKWEGSYICAQGVTGLTLTLK